LDSKFKTDEVVHGNGSIGVETSLLKLATRDTKKNSPCRCIRKKPTLLLKFFCSLVYFNSFFFLGAVQEDMSQ